jgi:hypothetical protein
MNAQRKVEHAADDVLSAIQESTIKCRFRSWANENKGGWYENIGFSDRNILVSIEQHGGEVPDRTGYRGTLVNYLADQIEDMLVMMRKLKSFRTAARVVEAEYLQHRLPLEEKLRWLSRKYGISISPSTYYKELKLAEAVAVGFTSASPGLTQRTIESLK